MKKRIFTITLTLFSLIINAQYKVITEVVQTPTMTNQSNIAIDASNNIFALAPIVSGGSPTAVLKTLPNGVCDTLIKTNAMGAYLSDIAIDLSGNIYLADGGNNKVLKFNAAGTLIPFCSTTVNNPLSLTCDASGNVYVTNNAATITIGKINSAGVYSYLVGGSSGYVDGAASVAKFSYISSMSLDALGNMYIIDNNMIRKIVLSTGFVSTVAGGSVVPTSSSDGVGTAAEFLSPQDLVVDATGKIFVEESDRIRVVTPTGTVTTLVAFNTNTLTTSILNGGLKGITVNSVNELHASRYVYPKSEIVKYVTSSCYVKTLSNTPSYNTATIEAEVNAIGNTTTCKFDYGTTIAYGASITATPGFIVGNANTNVQASLSGLIANTVYHYRAVGTNSLGTTNGSDMTFTTLAVVAPNATTNMANSITSNSADVFGLIDANGSNTTVYFEYGTTPAYGSTTTATPNNFSTNATTVSATITGLLPSTSYLYRVVAINTIGTSYGADQVFTTGVSTSLKEGSNSSSFTIYPNPTYNQLNIIGLNKNLKTLLITNVLGEVVNKIETNGGESLSIDTKNLTPGVYFIKTDAVAFKFIKE